ncbi:MAG: catalase family peroxidase [Pseudomonadota bacterium]
MKSENSIHCSDTKRPSVISTWPLAGILILAASNGLAEPAPVTPDQVVTAIEGTFGVTPGQRRNHTKGLCAVGEFKATAEAAGYSRSALFSGNSIPVIARFSLAGGNPNAPDTARSPRGMALQFKLPDGALQHMTMLNTPVFGAATPQTFLDHIVAIKPDPATGKPDPDKIKAFKANHPDSHAQARFLAENNPPVSYANSAFFGIHTFKFIDADNTTRLVRWRFIPQDGEQRLTDEAMKTAPKDFLESRLLERAKREPIRWDMLIAIGEAGDAETDPTVAWPDDRKSVRMGTLTLTGVMPQPGAACESINFDPLVIADGIAATDDPILQFRSPAYAVSFGKRLSGK